MEKELIREGALEWAAFEEKCPEREMVLEVLCRMLALAAKQDKLQSLDRVKYENLSACFMFVNHRMMKVQATSSFATRSGEILRVAGEMQQAALRLSADEDNGMRWAAVQAGACAAIAASCAYIWSLRASAAASAPPMAEFADIVCRAMDAWTRCAQESSFEFNNPPYFLEYSLREISLFLKRQLGRDAPWSELKPALAIAQSAAAVMVAASKARDAPTDLRARMTIGYAASIMLSLGYYPQRATERTSGNLYVVKEFWAASMTLLEATAKGLLACATLPIADDDLDEHSVHMSMSILAMACCGPINIAYTLWRTADEALGLTLNHPSLKARWQR